MIFRTERVIGLWRVTGLWATLALSLAGCGGPYTGAVSGKVTYQGKPLPGGLVTFVHPDGRIGQGQIQEDGTYSVPKAPGGDVKVTVRTVPPIPAMPAAIRLPGGVGGGKSETVYPAGKYTPIPKKYADVSTSGLSLTVRRGSQEFDINLEG
jgi:hypothetical protein